MFDIVFSGMFVVLRETTLTVSGYIETGSPVASEIVRVVCHSTTEITEITRSKKQPIFRVPYLKTFDVDQPPQSAKSNLDLEFLLLIDYFFMLRYQNIDLPRDLVNSLPHNPDF